MIDYRITIITLVLNQKNEIEKTVQSVLKQKSVNVEYIIVDGGSTDGTLSILMKHKSKISHVIYGINNGIYNAINEGLKYATSPIVGIIHCGDLLKDCALFKVCRKFYSSFPDIIYGDIEIVENLGNRVLNQKFSANHKQLIKRMSIFHPSTFVKRNVYNLYGTYDPYYKLAADYDFFLGLFLSNYSFCYIPEVLAVFKAGGISGKNFKLSRLENYSIRQKKVGRVDALKFYFLITVEHHYYRFRKKLIYAIIGQNNFNSLKLYFKSKL